MILIVCYGNHSYKYFLVTHNIMQPRVISGLIGLLAVKYSVCKFSEKKLQGLEMTDTAARLYNGIKENNEWSLRNGNSGSIVNFKNKNTQEDEWSLEITFKVPTLKYPEFAGIYAWYTEDPVRHGGFKGAKGKFNGIVAGLEFIGKGVDIIVSVNHGETDYTELAPDTIELKDSPDPNIFKDKNTLTLKIISTEKNFKIEIYDKDKNLIYDRVRYTQMAEISSRLSGKYFGLTTDYAASVKNAFKLVSASLYKREEHPEYDPNAYNADINETIPRLPHEIDPTEDMQHIISGIEHLTKYLRIVMGDPQGKPIADNVMYVKKVTNFMVAHILEVRDGLKSLIDVTKKHAQQEEGHRQELLYLVQNMNIRLTEMNKKGHNISVTAMISMGCGLFAVGFLLGKRFSPIKKMSLH
ncbi:hypothetical protein NEAUS05_0079 [Nematocida ausubeli]|nr:hypothetical protein NEAUS05_0079 [Nematocida ausubeli]